jgi:replicative DNA helicase
MQDNTININDTLKDLVDDVEDVIMVNEEHEDNSLEEAFNGFIDTEKKGISYGFKALDKYLKGMQEGHFVVLGGRPAMGKTAFALNIVRNVCRAGKKVLIFSLEMTKKDLYKRLVSCETGFSEDEIKEAVSDVVQNGETPTSRAMYRALETGKDRIANWNLDIIDDCYTLADIRARAVLAKKKQGVDVVVIDHLQLMSLYDGAYKEGRTAEMTEITKRLVPLAKRIKATILCLSQVNRGNEGRTDKRPMSSDLKESGSIEQDADAIMMIYRDKYYDENGDDWTEIIIRKNRFGAQGTVRLNYDMAKNKFTPYTGIVGEKANRSEKAQVKGAFE